MPQGSSFGLRAPQNAKRRTRKAMRNDVVALLTPKALGSPCRNSELSSGYLVAGTVLVGVSGADY